MRICDKCGCDNGDAQTDDDLWCAQCRNFLGFRVQTRVHERLVAVRLVEPQTSVDPGSEAVLAAVVRNSGDVVEKVSLTVEGSPAEWTVIEPPEVGLFPKREAEVRVVFRPPRSSRIRCGVTPFRLVATSQAETPVSDRADGAVDVGAFVEVRASLQPLRSSGAAGADHRLTLENAGNTQASIVITASQPGDDLALTVKPQSLQLGPGAKGEAQVNVVPRQPLYSAADKTYPFSVGIPVKGQSPITIQAHHVQEAAATAPTLVLADDRLRTTPGEEVATTVTIRNRGRGGDDYSLELLGPAAAWGRVTPQVIALPSAGEVDARIVFTPPLSPPALAAEIPFGLRCVSTADSKRPVVAEAVLTVEAVSDIDFEIEPKRVRSRWHTRHVIDIENRGNTTVDLRPVVVDSQHDLSLAVSPPRLQIPPSSRDVVLVKTRARRPKLLAKPSDRGFSVSFVPADHGTQHASRKDAMREDIDFEQIAVLPRKLTALVIFIAFVAGVVGAALLMFGSQINQWF
jgi:hypothetical protein